MGNRIYHFDGSGWEQHSVPGRAQIGQIWGAGPDDIYAAGTAGTIIHWNGTEWTIQQSGTELDLWGIHGAISGDIWVTGTGGVILHRSPL